MLSVLSDVVSMRDFTPKPAANPSANVMNSRNLNRACRMMGRMMNCESIF